MGFVGITAPEEFKLVSRVHVLACSSSGRRNFDLALIRNKKKIFRKKECDFSPPGISDIFESVD